MSYVRVFPEEYGDAAVCELLHNYENKYKLREGVPLAGEFPEDAEFRMSADYPNSLALVDVLYNLEHVLVVNARAREILERRCAPDLEFLPVNVVNHKGRKTKERYVVVNLLRRVDSVDKQKTKWKPSSLDPDMMSGVRNLTLDEARIPADAMLFRPVGLPTVMLARRDFADELQALGIKGLGVAEVATFKS